MIKSNGAKSEKTSQRRIGKAGFLVRGKGRIAAFLVIVALIGIIYLAWRYTVNKYHTDSAKLIAELSPDGSPPETIEGLRSAIALYEDHIEDLTESAAKAGIYWKILASRYIDKQMFSEALEALEQAISYYPADPTLFYMTGLCAANMSKSTLDFYGRSGLDESARLMELSVYAYRRSLELEPDYDRALYGLAVVYAFELEEYALAIPLLQRYLARQTRDVDAMFVLARCLYATADYQGAIDQYDAIISGTRDPAKKVDAETNKKTILDMLYE